VNRALTDTHFPTRAKGYPARVPLQGGLSGQTLILLAFPLLFSPSFEETLQNRDDKIADRPVLGLGDLGQLLPHFVGHAYIERIKLFLRSPHSGYIVAQQD
jgi:hypothetical protein